jgi:hypothetical protein
MECQEFEDNCVTRSSVILQFGRYYSGDQVEGDEGLDI